MIVEEWKPVVGYEQFYDVSDLGRVRSKRENTRIKDKENGIMRQKFDSHGYLRVNLNNGKSTKSKLISRLVAEAFIPNPEDLPFVGHDDDNKTNNYVNNLYWTDAKENNQHNGKMKRFQKSHNEKIEKIAKALSTPVIGTNLITGDEVRFNSMQEAERNGFQNSKISLCCSGKRKSHKGFKWRKANDNIG